MRRMANTVEAPRASTASTDGPPLAPAPRADTSTPAMHRPSSTRRVYAYLTPALVLYGLFVLWPLAQVVWLAFHRWDGYGPQTWIGGTNFELLSGDPIFAAALLRSIVWEIAGALIPTGLGLALALAARQARSRGGAPAALLVPALLPATVVAAVWVLVYSPVTGPLNSGLRAAGLGTLAADWLGDPHLALLALFVAWLWSSLGPGTLLMWAALGSIDEEYYLLARVEGAGALRRFYHVTLPGVKRARALAFVINAALAAQVFDLVFVTTGGGPGYATVLLPIDMYGRAFGGATGQGAAVATIQVVWGLLLALLFARAARGEGLPALGEPARRDAGALRRRIPWIVPLWGIIAVFLLPLLWLAVAAVEPARDFALSGARHVFQLHSWTGASFTAAWNAGMGGALVTSLLLAGGVVAATLLLSTPAAFALAYLARARVWRFAVLGVLLLGLLQPVPVLIIPLFALLHGLDLLNTPWGILLPEIAQALPFGVLVLWAAFRGEPAEILQAAEVDGASPLQCLLRVGVPLARPMLAAVAIWAFVTSWNQYLLPTVVSQDGSLQTVPMLLGTFLGRYNTAYGSLAAGTALAIMPTLLVILALRLPAATALQRVFRAAR